MKILLLIEWDRSGKSQTNSSSSIKRITVSSPAAAVSGTASSSRAVGSKHITLASPFEYRKPSSSVTVYLL